MSIALLTRRAIVTAGVVASIVLGVMTIRAAAAWTAASAPLEVAPASLEQLRAALAAEQNRSKALQDQLDALTAGSAELSAALETARARIGADGETAAGLQASLAAAQQKLASLEASLAAARQALAAQAAAAPAPPPGGATPGPGGTQEPHDDD
jgi:septal ring factor EnvC (AmiA/AmiB activator)